MDDTQGCRELGQASGQLIETDPLLNFFNFQTRYFWSFQVDYEKRKNLLMTKLRSSKMSYKLKYIYFPSLL